MTAAPNPTRTIDTTRYRERVKAGAAWLDENQPGWRDRVDAVRLSLRSGCDCILGQVFEEQAEAAPNLYDDGFDFAFQDREEAVGYNPVTARRWMCDHGFLWDQASPQGVSLDYEVRLLEKAWVAELDGAES